jgi:hypothetical protein
VPLEVQTEPFGINNACPLVNHENVEKLDETWFRQKLAAETTIIEHN